MIIRTNLASLVRKTPVHSRPTSLALLSAGLLIVLCLVNWYVKKETLDQLEVDHTFISNREGALTREIAAAQKRAEEMADTITRREAVIGLVRKRINWAPLLEKIFSVVPEGMSLASVHGAISSGTDFTLTVTGKIAAKQPRLECDKFRLVLADAIEEFGLNAKTRFTKLEDVEESLRLGEIVYPIAEFSIEVSWKN